MSLLGDRATGARRDLGCFLLRRDKFNEVVERLRATSKDQPGGQDLGPSSRTDSSSRSWDLRICSYNVTFDLLGIAHRRVLARIASIQALIADVATQGEPETGNWVEWLESIADALSIPISDDLRVLLSQIAERIGADPSQGVRDVITQLEPVARDLALQQPGVSIMSVARSKGLTFDVVITMGVEAELFPSPMSDDEEEGPLRVAVDTGLSELPI